MKKKKPFKKFDKKPKEVPLSKLEAEVEKFNKPFTDWLKSRKLGKKD